MLTWRSVRISDSFTGSSALTQGADVTGITARLTPTLGAVKNSTRKRKWTTRKRQHDQGAKLRSARDHKRLRNGLDGGGHRDVSVYIGFRIEFKNSLMSSSGGPARRFRWAGPFLYLGNSSAAAGPPRAGPRVGAGWLPVWWRGLTLGRDG